MARNSESLNTLISTSSTIAGMGLAIVGILAAKQSMQYSEMISDDMFLFSSIGFLLVVIGYLAQKHSEQHYYARLAHPRWRSLAPTPQNPPRRPCHARSLPNRWRLRLYRPR
ncbi:hypothetical protein [Kingella oralis]|uniref:hypothetical protein n=1 Tax=Kingella oralis TaxID=505 RepID=UPI0034E6161F